MTVQGYCITCQISEIEFRFVRDIGYFVINLKFHFKINNICHLVSELYLARVNIKRYTGVVAWLYLSISYLPDIIWGARRIQIILANCAAHA